jgi:nucleotide-binding universal stress UspA family protein
MIKGRSPYPFDTIALAVSFTPALPFLITEMRRLCDLHEARAVFIHSGKKTGEKQRELAALLNESLFSDVNSAIHWDQGEAVTGILQICKHEVVDLLLLGSNESASFGRPVGNNTTAIAKRAKCSVLLYARMQEGGFKKIVVNATDHNKTELTLQTGFYVAGKEKSSEVIIVEDDNSGNSGYDTATARQQLSMSRDTMEKESYKVTTAHLDSYRKLADFVFTNNADLVITRSSDHPLLIFDRISGTDGIDTLLNELPSNILIVHSRLAE